MHAQQTWHVTLPDDTEEFDALKLRFYTSTHMDEENRRKYDADLTSLRCALAYWMLIEYQAGNNAPSVPSLVQLVDYGAWED